MALTAVLRDARRIQREIAVGPEILLTQIADHLERGIEALARYADAIARDHNDLARPGVSGYIHKRTRGSRAVELKMARSTNILLACMAMLEVSIVR